MGAEGENLRIFHDLDKINRKITEIKIKYSLGQGVLWLYISRDLM